MSDPDNFLARWSRRKREVADAEADSEKDESRRPEAETPAAAKQNEPTPVPATHDTGGAEPAFDLTSLPSLESITAETDIRGFFAPGVPAELTRAALRRAWVADPKIRNFVGLEENAWDFNNPESIPGFGKLEMTDDLRREVQRIVGNLAPEPESEGADRSVQPPDVAEEFVAGSAPSQAPALDSGQSVAPPSEQERNLPQQSDELIAHSNSDAAVQKESEPAESVQVAAKRTHGGALPK